MRKHLLGLMLVAGLAGCTSETDPVADGAPEVATSRESAAAAPTGPSLAALRGSATSFASLPDRGELLSYGGARKNRQSGAYTYHPVAISEAHALNAIGSGELVVNTPDGEALRLKYERHEEQPDGNWTWIGRNHDGSSAVLTFGEKAVFGMISRGDDYYRVRTDRTGAWVVATDRSLVASGGGRREKGPDFLVPPDNGALVAAASRRMAKAAPGTIPGKAAPVVDVLIGYSNGLASVYGSQAAAATFVTSLAAITNVAYANSGVSMRLRVVHTLQVNYADNSDNQDALQQLTGYDADTQQPITPNTAFNALRDARDEYGADLVAFVRQYREPEQDGCGIAWLLGMNQSGISAADDAEFGYAVVSDGEDRDEGDGNTYFCSDFSLAHELGHLMGQAHNTQDAQGRAGAHTWSYGYRESSASGFFTIMAYPSGDGQLEIPHFGNPSVLYQSRPTGTATADNVRSMNITMPIIATFRATVVPLAITPNDFNGDGRSDILWRSSVSGANTIWRSASFANRYSITTVPTVWKVVGTGDFNGDGTTDLLWRHSTTGANVIWRSANSATQTAVTAIPNLSWIVAGIGDFNNDGSDDILWRNPSTGANTIWRSGNSATVTAVTTVPGAAWTVAGVGDFNHDNVADILWRNTVTGANTIWRSGNSSSVQAVASAPAAWRIVGTGDFDGDGYSDILWRNATSGANAIWRSGVSTSPRAISAAPNPWTVEAVGDYNGDGISDILWRHPGSGVNSIWLSGNSGSSAAVTTVTGNDWQVAP